MTTLTDVEQDYDPSPRVSVVLAPRTQFVAQDVVDTLRKIEDSWRGMSEPRLLSASGKEDLGGFNVGITYQLQDNQVQFEDRQAPVETGTITTASVAAIGGKIRVIDATALFQTALVERGSFIINWTDNSIVSVHQVISETELEVKVPTSGIGNTYDIADSYSVFNVERVFLDGGNATAVDDLASAISPVVPSVGTYAFLTLSSSATIVEALAAATISAQVAEIHGQVQRSVFVDTTAVASGDGYQQSPFNTFAAAANYAVTNGLTAIVVLSNATLDRAMVGYSFIGVGNPRLNFGGFNVNKSEFKSLTLAGTMNGVIHCHDCKLDNNLTGIDGHFWNCRFDGDITLGASADFECFDCYSAIGGSGRPTITLGTGNSDVAIRSYHGGLTILGVDAGGDTVTIGMAEGKLTLDSSCTAGEISVRGVAQFTDNSAGSTIDKTALIQPSKLLTIAKFIGLQ